MKRKSIREANDLVFKHVEGWVGDRMHQIVEFFDEVQRQRGIEGDIAEIGVHHGKLFFILAAMLRPGEQAVAIDLFEDQEKNVDASGRGSREMFLGHMRSHFPHLANSVKIIAGDSLSFQLGNLRETISRRGVRVFSVDGGHRVEHVVNDLTIAGELVVPFGFVMLDDFLGPHWPSVTEGFFKYMSVHNRRLAPLLIFQNKLILTTFSEQETALRLLREHLDRVVGDEFHLGRWRCALLCGASVLCFA